MVKLTAADELFVHQFPEPLPNVAIHHEHWRESYYFSIHPREALGDILILTMGQYPYQQELDSLQFGRINGQLLFARHARPFDGDPHTTVVGPVSVDVVEPYKTVKLTVDASPEAAVGFDLTFTARTQAYGLRRGTMKAGPEIIWDQSHMIQSGTYSGTYSYEGTTYKVDEWWGQRDHSWGIRDHQRCPMWMWLAIQLPDGMLGVWNWEYPNGARVYMDGCFAPADGSDPTPVIGFSHDLRWTGENGEPVDYGRDGADVHGLAGRVDIVLEGGKSIGVEGEGTWCARYGRFGGGQNNMAVRTDDGRTGNAVYEITGSYHHHFFPVARAENLPPG